MHQLDEAYIRTCYVERSVCESYNTECSHIVRFLPFDSSSRITQLLPEDISNQFLPNYTNNEAVIIYSSGTTGSAKGIILSHYAINTNADSIIEYMQLNSTDCMYLVQAISHSSTLTGELLVALKSKTKLLIAPIMASPKIVFRNIRKYEVSILCVNPMLLKIYIQELKRKDYHLSSLKRIYVSGDRLDYQDVLSTKKQYQMFKYTMHMDYLKPAL